MSSEISEGKPMQRLLTSGNKVLWTLYHSYLQICTYPYVDKLWIYGKHRLHALAMRSNPFSHSINPKIIYYFTLDHTRLQFCIFTQYKQRALLKSNAVPRVIKQDQRGTKSLILGVAARGEANRRISLGLCSPTAYILLLLLAPENTQPVLKRINSTAISLFWLFKGPLSQRDIPLHINRWQ